ncbi:hypothetical protein LTR37_002181 [Vermiconidia calcicola]|uniref:Uncharacterized protein n=1 Tax=Vermiconidia calcicola TaxID=1690605 RepID=A0ACC3NV94_9PEZI|nr:hypothetical protein LTR37_002181 [Vermiconidia calcicola]
MLRSTKSWLTVVLFALQHSNTLGTTIHTHYCKSTPGSLTCPTEADWYALNITIGGRLLKPAPPGAICHHDQPPYDSELCKTALWTNASTYADHPLGIINPNWSEDSCLREPQYPCSGAGFPIYVINATCAEDVAEGVNFAREHSIRLNVKGSGHDYLGRSTAPNSLSSWTKHIRGIVLHDAFQPQQCGACNMLPAVTLGTGEDWPGIYAAANQRNVTLVGGTGDKIGLGGYLTGGGHSPLSATYGLAADQVLEMDFVMADRKVVVATEAKNTELFWAMRGARAHQSIDPLVSLTTTSCLLPLLSLSVGAAPDSDAFWNLSSFIVSSTPRLQESGIVGYSYTAPAYPYNGTLVGGYIGGLLMPNGTVDQLEEAIAFMGDYIATIPDIRTLFVPVQYPSLYAWNLVNKSVGPIGKNNAIGNRLLDGKALSNVKELRAAMKKATPGGTISNLNLVAGPGLWAAEPAGGNASVTPAWRKAYVEYVVSVQWPFRNGTAKRIQTDLLTDVYMDALRELAPETGSPLNEGDVDEPDFQNAYWGSNYDRLLEIKRRVDPTDVFWCAVCVGSEVWAEENGGRLCRL